MFQNPNINYQFLYVVMASTENPMFNMSYSMEPTQQPLHIFDYDNNNYTMCRICGESVANIFNHLRFNHPKRRRQFKRFRSNPKIQCDPIVSCEYCANKMLKSSMDGHLLRKHNSTLNGNVRMAVKRKRTYPNNDDNRVIDQEIVKRQRFDADQTIMEALNDAFIQRQQTPPIESPTEIVANEPNKTTDVIEALPLVHFDKKTYNMVHISDQELNQLMVNGRIRIHNGHLYMNDSEQEQF